MTWRDLPERANGTGSVLHGRLSQQAHSGALLLAALEIPDDAPDQKEHEGRLLPVIECHGLARLCQQWTPPRRDGGHDLAMTTVRAAPPGLPERKRPGAWHSAGDFCH